MLCAAVPAGVELMAFGQRLELARNSLLVLRANFAV
jgi:hypothetical protein